MANPYATPHQLSVWKDSSKAVQITPAGGITRFAGIHEHLLVNEPGTFDLSIFLSDLPAKGVAEGAYVELTQGNLGYQQVTMSGYVAQTSRSADPQAFTLTCDEAWSYLASITVGDDLYGDPGLGYMNLLQWLNGINPAGSGAGTNQKGVMTGTLWRVKWVDNVSTPSGTATTTVGTAPVNATHLTVTSTAGATPGKAVQIAGEFYQVATGTTGTDLYIEAPGLITSVPLGGAVQYYNYALPGTFHRFYAANVSVLSILTKAAQKHAFYLRQGAGSTAHNGIVEAGWLGDPSDLTAYGGEQLAARQGHNTTTYAHQPNAGIAQAAGDAVIEAVSATRDLSQVVNTVFPFGHGHGDAAHLLRTLTGGDPPGNGWSGYMPHAGGRQYYVKSNSNTVTWQGDTFEFISFQRQDGKYQYGVIDRGGSDLSSPPPFDLRIIDFKDRQVTDPEDLLAEALATLKLQARPPHELTVGIRHPMTSASGLPTTPRPGQTVVLNYTGEAHDAIEIDDTPGPTYGQYIGVGPYRYLKIPTLADPTDENGTTIDAQSVQRMATVQEIEIWWEPGSYRQEIRTGQKPRRDTKWARDMAQEMATNHHAQPAPHSFYSKPWHGIRFFLSKSPYAYEGKDQGYLWLNPGAFAISDVADTTYFGDHHGVAFFVQFANDSEWLDFIFAKHVGPNLTSLNDGQIYGVARLACLSSGQTSGLYTTTDGTTFTQQGSGRKTDLWQSRQVSHTNVYRLYLEWAGGVWTMHLGGPRPDGTYDEEPVWHWRDSAHAIGYYGAIGFHSGGGSGQIAVYDLEARGKHLSSVAKGGVTTRHIRHSHHTRKRTRQTAAQYSGGGGSSLAKAM